VIVRILEEAQYELPPEAEAELHRIDQALLRHLDEGDEERFHQDFRAALDLVRTKGRVLPPETITASAFVLPKEPPTLAEAKELFREEA
jgi:hypothetical protein